MLPGDPMEDSRVRASSLKTLRGNGFSLVTVDVDAAEVKRAADALAARLAPEPVTVVAADAELAEALGARAGEVFVVRPDGLVLARLDGVAGVGEVADHLLAGTAPTGPAPADTGATLSPEQLKLESVWLGLSDALDQAEDREAFLTRIALLLGSQAGHREFEEAVALAADPRPALVQQAQAVR